jgi:hypothetical protein
MRAASSWSLSLADTPSGYRLRMRHQSSARTVVRLLARRPLRAIHSSGGHRTRTVSPRPHMHDGMQARNVERPESARSATERHAHRTRSMRGRMRPNPLGRMPHGFYARSGARPPSCTGVPYWVHSLGLLRSGRGSPRSQANTEGDTGDAAPRRTYFGWVGRSAISQPRMWPANAGRAFSLATLALRAGSHTCSRVEWPVRRTGSYLVGHDHGLGSHCLHSQGKMETAEG